jgi:MFS family permease
LTLGGEAMYVPKLYYGWILTTILGAMFFMANGSLLTSAAISNPLMGLDLQMSATQISLGVTLVIFSYGLGAPIVGFMIAHIGIRKTQMIGGALMACAAAGLSFVVVGPITYLICFTILGTSTIMVGQISVETAIGIWFVRYRGIAMTVAMTIGGLGAFGSPLIANALINVNGGNWRAAWYFFIAAGIVAIILAAFVVRESPEEIGLNPDGATESELRQGVEILPGKIASRVYKNLVGQEFFQVLRTSRFWLIAAVGAAGFLFYSLSTGVSTAHFANLGIDRMTIVTGVSSMGLSMLIGKLVCGAASDRIEPIRILAFCDALIAVAIVTGVLWQTYIAVYIFYGLAGFAYGGVIPCLPTSIANHFGRKALSKNIGVVMLICGLTSAAVPFAGGIIFDRSGSYLPVFLAVAAVAAACAIGGFLIRVSCSSEDFEEKRHYGEC